MQCHVIWTRKNSHGTLTTEENTLTTKELQCMMPSCRLASELRSQILQVFQVTSHIVGLVVLCAEIPIHLLSMHQTYSLLNCTRIPADLERMQFDVIWTRKNSQGTLTTEENTLTTKELQCMMPSCRLASELRSQILQVFQVTSHIVGLVVLCAEIPIHLLSMHQTYSLLACTRIP